MKIIPIKIISVSILIFLTLFCKNTSTNPIATQKNASNIFVNFCKEIWKSADTTKYTHTTGSVIDYDKGVFKYDCSGFIYAILLKKCLPEHAADLFQWKNKLHPKDSSVRVWTFYDYLHNEVLGNKNFAENKYWKVFNSIDSLKKGDLIIARYSDKWRSERINAGKSASTGHIMIAWEIGAVNKNNEVIIQVFDCSASGHSEDTRYLNSKPVAEINNDSKKPSGIGFGKMIFKINFQTRVAHAYKWTLTSKHWYNLQVGDEIIESDYYDRLKGIIFARPK